MFLTTPPLINVFSIHIALQGLRVGVLQVKKTRRKGLGEGLGEGLGKKTTR